MNALEKLGYKKNDSYHYPPFEKYEKTLGENNYYTINIYKNKAVKTEYSLGGYYGCSGTHEPAGITFEEMRAILEMKGEL